MWITGIVFIIIEKENKFVRFHAMQSIIVFGALTVIDIIFSWTFVIPIIIGVLMFVLWIIMMINAFQGKMLKLPLAGKLADKYSNPPNKS